MDCWCQFLMPLFAIVLLSGKLHFVLKHVEIAVEYFYTIFFSKKLASKLATNTSLVFTYIRARQTKCGKIPPW